MLVNQVFFGLVSPLLLPTWGITHLSLIFKSVSWNHSRAKWPLPICIKKHFLNGLTIFLNTKQDLLLKIPLFSSSHVNCYCFSPPIIYYVYRHFMIPNPEYTKLPKWLRSDRDCASPNADGYHLLKGWSEMVLRKGTLPAFLRPLVGRTPVHPTLERKPPCLCLWLCQHFYHSPCPSVISVGKKRIN